MWKFEVAFINEEGFYQWKGFGYAEQFERFLRKISKRGLKIVSISDWDAEGYGAEMKKRYLG